MFTGIIEAAAKIIEARDGLLIIERPTSFTDIKEGSSIAVSGVCLSVEELNKKSIRFSVVPETIRKTTLGSKKEGDLVNLERAMRADGRLDGHIVQGHVEGVGEVITFESSSSPRPPNVSSIPRPLPPEEEGEKKRNLPMGSNMLYFSRTWKAIRYDQLGVRFRRQFVIGERVLDFFCPSIRLAIEVDGGIHQDALQKKEDSIRDAFLREEHQIETLRFPNESVLQNLPSVVKTIRERLTDVSPPPPEEGLGVEEMKEGTLQIRVPASFLPNIVSKGSIAIDGVSLTVASIDGDQITVALIPHTLKHTTLGKLQSGDRVNVETDVLARQTPPPSFRASRPAKKLSEVRIGIVYSQWYPEIVELLRVSAIREFVKQGISKENISEHPSPGSFEIPLIGRHLAQEESVDALIALGVIVEGETHHADLIAREATRGCMDIQLHYGIPFGFEVLYVDDIALAEARRERGEEAAKAVLAVLRAKIENCA